MPRESGLSSGVLVAVREAYLPTERPLIDQATWYGPWHATSVEDVVVWVQRHANRLSVRERMRWTTRKPDPILRATWDASPWRWCLAHDVAERIRLTGEGMVITIPNATRPLHEPRENELFRWAAHRPQGRVCLHHWMESNGIPSGERPRLITGDTPLLVRELFANESTTRAPAHGGRRA